MSPNATAFHPATGKLAEVHALLDELNEIELWGLSDAELAEHQIQIERAVNRLTGGGLRVTREIDARGVAVASGSASTGTWLRDRLRVDAAEGKRRVKIARALAEECEATGVALAAGHINAEHAQAIAATMRRVGRKLPHDEREQAHAQLLDLAHLAEPEQVRKLGKHLEYVLDPDGPEPKERAAHARRSLHLRDLGEGFQRLTAVLPDLDAAKLKAALDALAKPRPAADGMRDERTATQRRYDGFIEIVDRYLRHNEEPKSHGNRPQLIITVGLDLLRSLPGARPGYTASGELVGEEQLRRLLCNTEVIRVLTGPKSMPLDVGRKYRVATDAQWAALLVRDRGCTGPNCDVPAGWCEAHHLVSWLDDGETNLANLALVCSHCHDLLHRGGWKARMGGSGRIEFIPPAHVDPTRRPRVNTYWSIADLFDPP